MSEKEVLASTVFEALEQKKGDRERRIPFPFSLP